MIRLAIYAICVLRKYIADESDTVCCENRKICCVLLEIFHKIIVKKSSFFVSIILDSYKYGYKIIYGSKQRTCKFSIEYMSVDILYT